MNQQEIFLLWSPGRETNTKVEHLIVFLQYHCMPMIIFKKKKSLIWTVYSLMWFYTVLVPGDFIANLNLLPKKEFAAQ